MQRLVPKNHKNSHWGTYHEQNGVMRPLPGNRLMATTLLTDGLTRQDLQNRGNYYHGLDTEQNQYSISTPSADNIKAFAQSQLGGKGLDDFTQSECYNFGRNYLNRSGIVADQFVEAFEAYNNAWQCGYNFGGNFREQKYLWIYEGMRAAAEATTPKGVLIGSYENKQPVSFRFGNTNPLASEYTDALASPSAARAGYWWWTKAGSTKMCPVIQGYISRLDLIGIYEIWYAMQRCAKACVGWGDTGLTLGPWLYYWYSLEHPQNWDQWGFAQNSFGWEHPITSGGGGKLYQMREMLGSFNSLLCKLLGALVFGKNGGTYGWEVGLRYQYTDQNNYENDPYKPASKWKPTNGSSPLPGNGVAPNFPPRPAAIANAPWIANNIFYDLTQAGGDNWTFARFKVGSGAWVEPDVTNILKGAAAYLSNSGNKGFALKSTDGNNHGIIYINPGAPRMGETVTIECASGKTVSGDVARNEPLCIAAYNPPSGNTHFSRVTAYTS